MAIKQVRVKVNNVWTTLTLDSNDGLYKATLTAPTITSYNVNSEHYYPVTIEATNMANTVTTVDDTHSSLGEFCKLKVKEITAPTIAITSPTSGQYFGTATPQFKFTVVDEANGSGVSISTLKITLDGTTYTNTSSGVTVASITNGYSVTFTPQSALKDGSHKFKVSVNDNDGNVATSSEVSFTTDTIAPTLNVTNPATNGTYTAESTLVVTGTASDSTSGTPTVTVKVNNGSAQAVTVSNGAFSKSVTLTNGNNTIVVTATDKAGKVTTITRTIILDTSSPVVASISITPNPVNVGGTYTVVVNVE